MMWGMRTLLLLTLSLPEGTISITRADIYTPDYPNKVFPDHRIIGIPVPGSNRCASRIESRMETMKKIQASDTRDPVKSGNALIDLAGYALHQSLQTAPYDMYVTNMKVHVPARTGWFRIERCYYDPYNTSVETRLTFRDLKVSGMVRLYDEKAVLQDPLLPLPVETCNMTIRLRHAGLGISALPVHVSTDNVELRTSAQFEKPEFVSVYAYGCRLPSREHRRSTNINTPSVLEKRQEADFTQEVEDVFLRGIQSLLTRYMEKQLQPALKETLMSNMGYTVSYG